ncbi:MAG: diaminopimelate epimerase [Rhodospirillales bacterium]|jgi:diaminopimelate epimerase|nr:diaminopimelate epimerase [Rhodospirillales bacterium]
MTGLAFTKMHGLGNDFVVLDARAAPLALTDAEVRAIADRRTGVGCDQLLVVEPPRNGAADAFLRIRNADGGEVAACGNGTRCVAAMIMAEKGAERVLVETQAGVLEARAGAAGEIAVDMGSASLEWRDIPLARDADTLHLDIAAGPLTDPVGVGIGNPHAVFFVDDAEAVPLDAVGPEIEHHPLFPEHANVEAAQVLSRRRLRLRVWERGVGITRACGSGACAALVAAHARGLTERTADVDLDGGTLKIEWREDGHVIMTGPVAVSFAGTLSGALLA